MARYTGPRVRVSRRLGFNVIEDGYQSSMGYFGEWRQVSRMDDEIISTNLLKNRSGDFYKTDAEKFTYGECNEIFV